MNRWIVGMVGALMLAGGGMAYYLSSRPPASGIPQEVIDRQKFPKGTGDMVGNSKGEICHEVRLQNSSGTHVIGREEVIPGADFQHLNGAEKESAIKASMKRILEGAGLMACASDPALPFPGLASDATAQPHCLDCGGGCGGVSCPAHVVPNNYGYCEMQGPDCIITIICCTGSCNCW